jgi:hypothetical protein
MTQAKIRPNLLAYEKKIHSQNGEDGVIASIFEDIGLEFKISVEFGIGPNFRDRMYSNGLEGNTVLLQKNGWHCEYWDVNEHPPEYNVRREYISPDNINALIKKYDVENLDLISIDVDSVDFWIWAAFDYSPRVVVIEYNANFLDYNAAFTIPNLKGHRWDSTKYFGASYGALKRLGRRKGYLPVYSNGVNVIFVLKSAFSNHEDFADGDIYRGMSIHRHDPLNRPWVDVSSL